MNVDITKEIIFSTARSGGKGGQNVNKVETMVEGRWHVDSSSIITQEQAIIIHQKLQHRISKEGFLIVKSQADRTQLGNKELVIDKLNECINKSLVKKKTRIACKIPKSVIENRLKNKKQIAFVKQNRRRLHRDDY